MKTHSRSFSPLFALFLSACNLPSDDPQGAEANAPFAAQTVEALLQISPTATSDSLRLGHPPSHPLHFLRIQIPCRLRNAVNLPTSSICYGCDDPHGTARLLRQGFAKKWRICNTGTCAWNGYNLVFDSGDSTSGPATQPIGAVYPGQEVDIEVNPVAVASAGNVAAIGASSPIAMYSCLC